MTHHRPTVWGAFTLLMLQSTACRQAVPELPERIEAQLNRQYPGWSYARLNRFNRDQLGPGQSPETVRGDFDGNGETDWAVQIIHADDRPGKSQSILVFLHRLNGYTVHVVETGSENQGTYLGVSPPGPHRDVVEDTSVVAGGDVLDVLYGQEASVGYLYRYGRFLSYTTGD